MICRSDPPSSRAGKGARGYTFLELALALAIIAVVFFAVIPVISGNRSEQQLRGAMEELTLAVRRACLEAEKSGRPIQLRLHPQGFVREKEAGQSIGKLAGNSRLFVRFPQGNWEPANDQVLNIFSIGVVVPIGLRIEQGSRWIEADLDFLTGNVHDERYSF